jgi:methylated-DNA-[protein]-cysteine S-methyltransferase
MTTATMRACWTVLEPTPVGPLLLTAEDGELTGLHFGLDGVELDPAARHDDEPVLARARAQLTAYFRGQLHEFDLPLRLDGTAFQRRVWEQLRLIPYGTTISYGELARRVGDPHASRAVGLANGRNPVAVIVPCHRVVGADGSLTGFGGGVDRKRALLDLEADTLF